MENPEHLSTSLQKSTKALQRPQIEKSRLAQNQFRLTQTLKTRKSIDIAQNYEWSQSPRSISSFLQDQSTNESKGSNKNLIKHKKRLSFFEKTIDSIYPRTDDEEMKLNGPKWNQQKTGFNFNLRKFTQILSHSAFENNSPRKDTIPGAEQHFDSSKLQAITMKNFRTLQSSLKSKQKYEKVRSRINQSLNLPQIYCVNEQTKKQKSKFYTIHPYLLQKQDTKRLERRADKRKNLIALEQVYIKLRNKQTSRIYVKKQN